MSKNKSIRYQVQGELVKKLDIGESRHKENQKRKYEKSGKIHSWTTYNDYVKHCTLFGEWVKANHGVKKITEMKKYAADYLNYRIEQGLSAWTVKLDAAALAKLYDCSLTDFGVEMPERKRADIKRSRGKIKDFDEEKNREIVAFSLGVGLFLREMKRVKKRDVIQKGEKVFVIVKGRNGENERSVPVRKGYEKDVLAIANRYTDNNAFLFLKSEIPHRFPCQKYRAMYAKAQYEALARPVDAIPAKDRYFCRKDKKGVIYDKAAMKKVAKMLGHTRYNNMAVNYLY